jgi:hypothetical protein
MQRGEYILFVFYGRKHKGIEDASFQSDSIQLKRELCIV